MVLKGVAWSRDIGHEVYYIVCVKGEGLGGCFSIFLLQMTFGSCGVDGGLVMLDGPEMFGIVCVCGIVPVNGLENGESIWVLIGWMCCLLHLYL